MNSLPLIQQFNPAPPVSTVFRHLADWPGLALFDSSLVRSPLGRYSFLTAKPFDVFRVDHAKYGLDPFHEVAERLVEFAVPAVPGLPPFQGGAAGILSYELGQCFERLPEAPRNDFQFPAAAIGLYSWVIAWDHLQDRCWFLSHGFPETSPAARQQLAQQQWESVRAALEQLPPAWPAVETSQEQPWGHTEPQLPNLAGLRSNFSRTDYFTAVRRVIDDIVAGEIFQANLSQRLVIPARCSAGEQYLRLRQHNPAPFAGYMALDDWAVLSSSPERFLQLRGDEVSTRPIKGTRRRRVAPEADLYTRDELRESEKDRAENVMIVDLLRNDLSRVCRPGSVWVPELCTVEAYETVSHLVSEVRGRLRAGTTFWDLLRATFPGGSITGAPKIRAMQIITEREQVARGPYCGSLFYSGFDGSADSNILIRSILQQQGWLSLAVGGGIVAQSDPQQEYEETLHKASGMLRSL